VYFATIKGIGRRGFVGQHMAIILGLSMPIVLTQLGPARVTRRSIYLSKGNYKFAIHRSVA
jgi:hypothetical protein